MFASDRTSELHRLFNDRLINILINYRILFALLSLAMIIVASYGLKYLTFDAEYKVFFKKLYIFLIKKF